VAVSLTLLDSRKETRPGCTTVPIPEGRSRIWIHPEKALTKGLLDQRRSVQDPASTQDEDDGGGSKQTGAIYRGHSGRAG
jgi:hypothetical protein